MLPSGGTGCGAGGPDSTWGGGGSRAVRLLCCMMLPHSKETPGAIPGTRWHLPAQGSTADTPGSRGGRRRVAASARGDSSGWVVCASSPCRGHSPTMGTPMEPGATHTHRQPGARGGRPVRLPEPRRVGRGDTGGAGAPEQGLAVTGAAGGSVGCASWDVTTGVWGWPGLPGEQGGSRAGHWHPLVNLQALLGPRESLGRLADTGRCLARGSGCPTGPWTTYSGSCTFPPYLSCSFSTTKSRRRP